MLSHGLDTPIMRILDNDGIELSGGQHQKLAIARTIFRNNSVLILDEPSSSLDPETEYKIFKFFKHLSNQKTIIFTSHRLSNVYLAERVIVLEDGKIVEDGNREDLLKKNSRFAELYNYQKLKFL